MPWELTGNNGTNPTTDFLGTTDARPLAIRTNGAERMRLDTLGNVEVRRDLKVGGNVNVSKNVFAEGTIQSRFGGVKAASTVTSKFLEVRGPGVDTEVLPPFPTDTAARFSRGNVVVNGSVTVTGDIQLANGGDCAEEFEVDTTCPQDLVPGTVVVLGDEGFLRASSSSYDKRVAGVVSGGGDYKPGIVLDKQQAQQDRKAIALLGKVVCKVDANYQAIEVGDLLTTSDRPGHAMKADDPFKAFGAVLGKALRPLKGGQGLIPVLVALQ